MNAQISKSDDAESARLDAGDVQPISLRVLIDLGIRQRWLTSIVALLTAAAIVAPVAMRGPTYSSVTSFMLKSAAPRNALAGIAAQFYGPLTGVETSQSPQFYADLIKSRNILWPVAEANYVISGPRGRIEGNLHEILGGGTVGDSAVLRETTVQVLASALDAQVRRETGVIVLRTSTPNRELSVQISQRVLDELNRFNRETRRSQATAEREFTEGRLAEAAEQLRVAESQLQNFLLVNRDYSQSPRLQFEQERLAREVIMRQQLYASLAQAHEQAKIEEIRDSPVITIIQAPEAALQPDRRGLVSRAMLGIVLGLSFGFGAALIREYLSLI